jgi:hypothetical protein
MGKSPPPDSFTIHVDPSCLTDSTDLELPKERKSSDDISNNNSSENNTVEAANIEEPELNEPAPRPDIFDERIQAQIHEAARKVVESIERDRFDAQEPSLLSMQTDESYEQTTELTFDGTEVTYEDTEASYETEGESQDEVEEAPSVLDSHIDQAMKAWDPEIEHVDDEVEEAEDSSSHHDGDVDDVFSENSGRSQRSSMNSVHEFTSSDEAYQKALTSPSVGEEAATSHTDGTVSRIPSMASYTVDETNLHTPSRTKHRPPFRTPSSVRAMQMSSPTPSIFSSPRSAKRHLPTGSRIGTPTSQFSPSKRTPTRFKQKKEEPLVLLHVTVMPLQWQYAHAMASRESPESLQHVKESWGLLVEKLTDTVLERGVLLAHPQESYEVLEERLLEALELPVRPRAQILKCGHYMGPLDLDSASSDDDENLTTQRFFQHTQGSDRKWCDICRKDVRLQETGETFGKRRFNVKIYASNGLMRAGAWAAAWREMERVDVEIEPWVELDLRTQLEELATSVSRPEILVEDVEDDFVDEDEIGDKLIVRDVESADQKSEEDQHRQSVEEQELRRKFEEEELAHRMMEEEELQNLLAEERALEQHIQEDEARRKLAEKARDREIYGEPHSPPPLQTDDEVYGMNVRTKGQPKDTVNPDSLPELLLAAAKVLLRDRKNIAIGVLSFIVMLLALTPNKHLKAEHSDTALSNDPAEIITETSQEMVSYVTIVATSTVESPPQTVTKFEKYLAETATNEPKAELEEIMEPQEPEEKSVADAPSDDNLANESQAEPLVEVMSIKREEEKMVIEGSEDESVKTAAVEQLPEEVVETLENQSSEAMGSKVAEKSEI